MARFCPSLLLLVATMALVSRGIHTWGSSKVVRKFEDIPETYVYVQQALWFAMKEYNKASKDKYTFKVVKVLKSQEQVGGHLLLTSPHVCSCGVVIIHGWLLRPGSGKQLRDVFSQIYELNCLILYYSGMR